MAEARKYMNLAKGDSDFLEVARTLESIQAIRKLNDYEITKGQIKAFEEGIDKLQIRLELECKSQKDKDKI